jgi:hypothetical protein
MKKTTAYHRLFFLFIITAGCLLLAGCEKKEDPPDMAPENWLERSYIGILTVQYTSVYPEWDVSTQMDVVIDKELGAVTIDNATLDYSGETLVSDDSKIERSGSWGLYPTGRLEGTWDDRYVFIDAGIVIQNDMQKIYAKDDEGAWQLVSSLDFSGSEPNSDLTFDFDDAIINGSIISVTTNAGSLTWTLYLTPALD